LCTIVPLIHPQARIHHAKKKVIVLVIELALLMRLMSIQLTH
jgi:hypothetical protein